MEKYLCISATYLDPQFHGRGDGGQPEWPPSPLRLMQAFVAANADALDDQGRLSSALEWLESQSPPLIIAPAAEAGQPCYLSVPNNAMDIVGSAWANGNYFGGGDANPATHRTMKAVQPMRMMGGNRIHYMWPLENTATVNNEIIQSLCLAAKRLVCLGWGVDLVAGDGELIEETTVAHLPGERWVSTESAAANSLRVPMKGTLAALQDRYESFLHRLVADGFSPVEPLTTFEISGYRRPTDPVDRPFAVFQLRTEDDAFFRYPPSKLFHIAGMVRHQAIKAMEFDPPSDVQDAAGWVDRFVAGHARDHADPHSQFSYLPLCSIGNEHTDPSIRRVMVSAPVGKDAWLEYLAERLDGRTLEAEQGNEFGEQDPPTLARVNTRNDSMAWQYTKPANRWASVTPVILPGHGDRKAGKIIRLIKRSLMEAGIEQPCSFEWSSISHFPKVLPAHKFDRDRKPLYFKPTYLQNFTSLHITLTFDNGIKVPGPIALGAGRHCGFGLMAVLK